MVLEQNEVSFVPVPYGNAQQGMKDLSESAAPGNFGLPWLDPCVFSPRQSWLAGARATVRFLSPKRLSRGVHVPYEPKKSERRILDL